MAEELANYDEAKVPAYTLPEVLKCQDGTVATDAAGWQRHRRPEVLQLFESLMYGKAPGRPETVTSTVDSVETALEGTATRKQISLCFEGQGQTLCAKLLVYLPAGQQAPVPTFVGLNFIGNHAIHSDPGIELPTSWMPEAPGSVPGDHRATDATRGRASSRWPVERILQRGYGLATMYCGDFDPDFDDGFQNGVHTLFPRDDSKGDAWGTLGAWAWGLSRAMDYFEQDPDIDQRQILVVGHSRLGKAALWAGATDPRFAVVISNDSGCGGAALSRREFGETVERINRVFPHWFCTAFKSYGHRVAELPFDQHMLLALMAPRPVYVASAQEDLWADPHGEFLAALAANPVYQLYGSEGLPCLKMPEVDQPVHGRIGYHMRTGKHDITAYDWDQYMNFADRAFAR